MIRHCLIFSEKFLTDHKHDRKVKIENNDSDREFQVRLCTKLQSLSVANTPFTVPAIVTPEGLSTFFKELLEKNTETEEVSL